MDAANLTPGGVAISRHFDDPEAVKEAVRGANVEFVPLSRGRYEADLTMVLLNGFRLQRSTMPPNRARGIAEPSTVTLLVSLGPRAAPLVNGMALGDGQLAVLRAGQEFDGIARDGLAWSSLTLDETVAEDLAERWQLPTTLARASAVLATDRLAMDRLRRAMAAITDLGDELPVVVGNPAVCAALGDALMDNLGSLRFGDASAPARRVTRDVTRIVAAAEDFLAASGSRPIYLGELCRALGVSERKLHGAFAIACGVSPHAYLKYRRLLMVRRVLRAGGGSAGLVKSAALAHGFWHLGNFARDYRAYFGEGPSETLRAGQGTRLRPYDDPVDALALPA
ncbi:MAG: helix-turn-helix domain-containing protein [Alphaproteobacteria bacterium]